MKRIFSDVLSVTVVFLAFTLKVNAVALPLESRLGGLAFYDPNLDITWAADAGISGTALWQAQVDWAASLTIGGIDGWRLASADVDGNGSVLACSRVDPGCEDNEMSFLFWEEGISTTTPGPFSNVQNSYWSGTPLNQQAWIFDFGTGNDTSTANKSISARYGWAVRDGDVIPIPAAAWLFGSALLGLLGAAKRRMA